ncbi:uncharacterized protein isoform X2 [Musca autumnalis]|uniref:uncharacterized protein isoform X2 n=1 Tax=Musca autumnalis TaxID=221902 RepID=UPI003CF8F7D4
MAQRTLTYFFESSITNTTGDFEEEEDDSIASFDDCGGIGIAKDISYYQELITKKENIGNFAKVTATKKASAACWDHFGSLMVANKIVLEGYHFCKICLEQSSLLKRFGKNTSTTNLTNHLKHVHNISANTKSSEKSRITTLSALQATGSSSKFVNARKLAEMCCIDLQPFNIVERQGFTKYVSSLDASTIFPSSKTLATKALDDVYNVYFERVKNALKKSKHLTLVLDLWSDKYKKLSYINVKVHFCSDFDLKHYSLMTQYFPKPHDNVAITHQVQKCLEAFDAQNKCNKAVSDGGSNIVCSLKKQNIVRYSCLAHTMHLFLMHDVLQNSKFSVLNDVIVKLKHIYKALKFKGEELAEMQQLKDTGKIHDIISQICEVDENMDADDCYNLGDLETELQEATTYKAGQSLKNSVSTRWNSVLRMARSFQENIELINIMLVQIGSESLVIPRMERLLFSEFINFLAIFEESTTYLQGQEYATLPSCIYFIESIFSKIKENQFASEFEVIIHLYSFAEDNFYKRFKITKSHVVAALMDPCQKNWDALDKYLKKIPKNTVVEDNYVLTNDFESYYSREQLIYSEIRKLELDPITPLQLEEPPLKKEKVSSTRKKMLDFVHKTSNTITNDSLIQEVRKYLEIPVDNAETLDWWKEHVKDWRTCQYLLRHSSYICFI